MRRPFTVVYGMLRERKKSCFPSISQASDFRACPAGAHLGELGVTEGDVLGGGLQRADYVAQSAQRLVDALGLLQRLPHHLAAPDPLRPCAKATAHGVVL